MIRKNNAIHRGFFGRSGETRTRGLLLPKQARYQLRYTQLWNFLIVVKYGVNAGF